MYDTDEFNKLADKLAKDLKTPQDISGTIKRFPVLFGLHHHHYYRSSA